MQRPLRSIHLFLLLAVQAAAAMTPVDAPAPGTSGGITEIVVERAACNGSCPVDTLVLHDNGKAEYTGRQNTRLTGEHLGAFWKTDFDRLAQWLVAQGFFQMQDSYGTRKAGTAGLVIRITRGGERKSVTSHAPDQSLELWSMGNAIRAVTADMRWQPAHSGLRGQITWKPAGEDWRPRPGEYLRVTPAGTAETLTFATDREGRFEINLAPGTYSVTWNFHEGAPRTLVVEADQFTQADFRYEAPVTAPAATAAYLASLPPPPPEDGLYLAARGGREKWSLRQEQRTFRLDEKTEPTILEKRLDSESVDNTVFLLTLTIPFDAKVTPSSHVLVVGGKALEAVCAGGGDTSRLCFRMTGEERAREVAKYFGITVGYFTRPDYKLRVSITPARQSFKRGEAITATLQVVNAGSDYPSFREDMSTSRRDDFSFTARHNGKVVTDISFPGDRGGKATLRGLAPGKTFEDTVDLRKWFEFREAGTYEIHGSYRLNIQVSGSLTKPYVQWSDYAETDFVVTIE